MKKFLFLINLAGAFLSSYTSSFGAVAVPVPPSDDHRFSTQIKGPRSMHHSFSKEEIGSMFMQVVDGRNDPMSLLRGGWESLPTKSDEDVDGLSETYLIEGYKELYFRFEHEKDVENAAKALWRASQIQEYAEGLFTVFLKDLGIHSSRPTEEEINHILRTKFSRKS
ncbi:MAG: hypothetical protein FJX18_05425 [Alphaproteobacteria bacterium]|nr:hypothetical protein [Alphaproteobacteria bacterium]